MAIFDVDIRQMLSLIQLLERTQAVGGVSNWSGMEEVIVHNIRTAFGRQGPGWVALAKSTKVNRIQEGFAPDGKILQRSGDLLKGMTDEAIFTKGATTFDYRPSSAVSGIAAAHQTGKGKLPKREIINKKTITKSVVKAYRKSFDKSVSEMWDTGIRTFD